MFPSLKERQSADSRRKLMSKINVEEQELWRWNQWEEVTANKKKKERKMFESGMKMLIGGISDKGGN